MSTPIETAVIGAIVTFFAALFTTLVSYFRERSEKEKWKRTLELEERRIRHEENQWALELHSQREMELHKIRLRTYPEIFAALGQLSGFNIHQRTESQLQELADKFNQWGYGEAGLCMLPDTREAVFSLRDNLLTLVKKEVNPLVVVNDARVDVIELLRRDLNLAGSLWRELKSLMEVNREEVRRSLEVPTLPTTSKPSIPFTRFLFLDSVNQTPLYGQDVKTVQQRLHELGYIQIGEVDGYFRSTTEAAVKGFQRFNGLREDGIVGRQTWGRLFSEDAIPKS